MTAYTRHFQTRQTPQSDPIPGKSMSPNNAGGHGFAVDDWTQLDRFLILGAEGGTFYVEEKSLTVANAQAVVRCVESDGSRVVNRIVEISRSGRAPKNDPAIFALAICAGMGSPATRSESMLAIPFVCRTGTHLFQFLETVKGFRGWGRSLRRAVAQWYTDKAPDDLALQVIKYRQRGGWSHRDALRKSHPVADGSIGQILKYAAGKTGDDTSGLPRVIVGRELIQKATSPSSAAALVREYDLPRESVPTELLNSKEVWGALLEKMPMTAMIRNLGNMSKVGLLAPMSEAVNAVCAKLSDADQLHRSRIHPMSILMAIKTYASGSGIRGSGSWVPVPQIVDALNSAFYASFVNVEPTGKRWMLGVDVSGSMSSPASGTVLSCAEAAAATALVVAKTEPSYYAHGFSGNFVDLGISPSMRLDDVLRKTRSMAFGPTDCAVPMLYAAANDIPVDVFVVLTDCETWYGKVHPCQALNQYRQKTGIHAKMIVVGMAGNSFTIADPDDAGMMDVVGFDAAVPRLMADFATQQINPPSPA